MIITLLLLAEMLFVVYSVTKVDYPFSKKGRPYKEYDKDGFLTEDSYRSHIAVYPNGSMRVTGDALFETRAFKETLERCKPLSDAIKKYGSVTILD